MSKWVGILIFSTLLTLVGCSSTSFSTKEPITVSKIVKISKDIPPEAIPYVPRFVASLQRNGFEIKDTSNSNSLELRIDVNNSITDMRFTASIWHSGVPVLSASATNAGFGTLLARGSAMNDLAETALERFDKELESLMAHTTFSEE